MPSFEVKLSERDLELLGTDDREEIEAWLAMLAETALGGLADQMLMPKDDVDSEDS